MAKKATKTLAASNAARLNNTLYISLSVHTLFLLLRALFYHSTFTRSSLILYALLSTPSLLITLYFNKLSRPTYTATGTIKNAGEDLDAKGLTEYMWDVVYWSWGCVVLAALVGDRAWWLWIAVPGYSGWKAWTVYTGMRGGGGGGGYQDAAGMPQPEVASKRQAKMEKRGGQKVAYR
ncbi:DUF788-domain-containing protein [Clathrospora elynae]|uniref:DUF788-domain-containing protein n=1 Tax=Clathrospora elynae TaxID=706981 RepID=A0A6A5SQQ5_9PLEO|nr:DUF788-domain-containing protein [Clathrospora elynae]